MQKDDVGERRRAAKNVGRFGPRAAEAVPALVELLADEVILVRKEAAIVLGKIGPAAESAIPALTALKDARIVGLHAKKALKKIAGK